MAVIAAEIQLEWRGEVRLQDLPLLAATKCWKGAILAYDAAGFIISMSDTAGLKMAGIANETVDNTGASGAKSIEVANGEVKLPGSSLEQADAGRLVYAGGDSQTVTDGTAATNDIPCGTLVEFISATSGWVNTLAIPEVAST